jgi:hypothetical protein
VKCPLGTTVAVATSAQNTHGLADRLQTAAGTVQHSPLLRPASIYKITNKNLNKTRLNNFNVFNRTVTQVFKEMPTKLIEKIAVTHKVKKKIAYFMKPVFT